MTGSHRDTETRPVHAVSGTDRPDGDETGTEIASGHDAGLRRVVRAQGLSVIFEVICPLLLFYGLRAVGVGQWGALLAGVLVAAPYAVWTLWRARRIDPIALVTLSVLALSVGLGLLSDDPRSLAIREGWTAAIGGLIGAWMLVSVAVGTPAQLTLGRTVAEIKRGRAGADAWAARWHTDPRFRRGLRVDTAAWGAVLLANAVVHVVLVYLLPVDLIPLVTTLAWFAGLGALIAWHVWYIRKEHLDA